MKKIIALTLLLITFVLPLVAFDGFTDIFAPLEEETPITVSQKRGVNLGGSVSYFIEGMKQEDSNDFQTTTKGGLNLDLSWHGSIVDAKTTLTLFPTLDNEMNWRDILTHLSILTYFDGGRIEVGLLKKEWGSGDGIHVVDVLNAPDYTNGLVDDPLEMKVAEPMIYTTVNWNDTSFEVVYKPMLIPMIAEEEGRWSMPMPSLGNLPPLTPDPPETEELATLSHSQFGSRIKTTLGPADIGLIYWNGYYTTPSFKLNPDFSVDLTFTRAQLFGAEATLIMGPFTLMVEGGYWLSEDYKATDPFLYNNRWVYLAGLGYMIPKTSAYLNVTYSGQYIVDFEKDLWTPPIPVIDPLSVDTLQASISSDGKAYMNTITAALEIPFAREKVKLRLAGTYQVETKGYALLPSISWNVSDDLVFSAKGRFFGALEEGTESLFKKWENNDNFSVGVSYLF